MRTCEFARWIWGLALCLGAAGAFAAGEGSTVWRTDFDAACAEAEKLQRPLLIHFYGTYCPPCRRMDREVLNTAETLDVLHAKFVAVKIDAGDGNNAKSARLVQRFGVHGLPCDVILDPLSGRVLSQVEGFQDQRSYVTTALRSHGKFDQTLQTHLARTDKKPKTPPREPDHAAEIGGGAETIQLGDPAPIVGLDGFSPVALHQSERWQRGVPEYAWEYKGVSYYLASKEEWEQFRAHPEQYAPRLLGCDPVVLWETDRAVAGQTRYGAFYDGELYLFQSAETRSRFKANPPRYTRIQHVLKVEHIQRTAMK